MNSASNKMDANLTGMWVSFFTAASIPSDVSATYALTFAENRIQSDMLLDLNKEYLRDMGITRMGDVIAILRHAKCVHESAARDRVLSSAVVAKVPVAAVTGRSTAAAPQPTTQTAASRILERYTRNPAPSPETSPPGKRKLNTGANTEDNVKKSRLIRFEAATSAASKEGPLAKQAPVPAKQTVTMNKQTVFARLGNTEPVIMTKTITTAKTTKSEPKPIYARLGSKSDAEVRDIPIQVDALKYEGILKGNPVPKKIVTVTTSSNNVRKIAMGTGKSTVVAMAPVRLATAGKVTMAPGRVAMTTGKVSLSTGCTMRADETPVSVKDKLALPKSVKFSSKVEYKEIETIKKLPLPVRPKFTPVFNKPERRLSMPETDEASSLKTRLGMKKGKSLTITKNVFDRLGV